MIKVLFIERINNFHFSSHKYYNFKIMLEIIEKALIVSDWDKISWKRGKSRTKERKISLDETIFKKPSSYKYTPKYI